MPKIAIMTDSNCGITPDDAQKYHIHILPMPVLVGEDTFYEGCNITSEEFYRKLFFRRTCYNFSAIACGCHEDVGSAAERT